MFDVKNLAISDSTVVHLTHPATGDKLYADDKETKPVTVTVASTASREYRTAVNAMHNRSINRQRTGKKPLSAAEQREEGIELLVAVCRDSSNLVYGGEPVKSPEQFRALLQDDTVSWIKAQIDEALGNVELFIK